MYRLKPNEAPFEVVDGPCTHQKYAHGINYPEIPPDEADKFEADDLNQQPATRNLQYGPSDMQPGPSHLQRGTGIEDGGDA